MTQPVELEVEIDLEEVLGDLKAQLGDVKRNKQLDKMASIPADVRDYMRQTVWPMLEAMIETQQKVCAAVIDQEDSIADLAEESGDMLHAETAEKIGKPIALLLVLTNELEKRLNPVDVNDKRLRDMIAEARASGNIALSILREVAINDSASGEAEEGQEPDDEESEEDADE